LIECIAQKESIRTFTYPMLALHLIYAFIYAHDCFMSSKLAQNAMLIRSRATPNATCKYRPNAITREVRTMGIIRSTP
jgi:hypothetical protein